MEADPATEAAAVAPEMGGSHEAMDMDIVYQLQDTYFGELMLTGSPEQMDLQNRLSIRKQIFCDSVPKLVLPFKRNEHTIYPCFGCGNEFVFENSYEYHINRTSQQITFKCRFCKESIVFYNRCLLLLHIRNHDFEALPINVDDIVIEPLPRSFFTSAPPLDASATNSQKIGGICYECHSHMTVITGVENQDRACHMKRTNEALSCPICLFVLPTTCALTAHLRFHVKCAPFFCPECGVNLPAKDVQYPYGHECNGFKMMRNSSRLPCPVPGCHLLLPNELKDHLKEIHVKTIYRCPLCVMASFTEATLNKHLIEHNIKDAKSLLFFYCALCPGKLVIYKGIDNHLSKHTTEIVYPCWSCGDNLKEAFALLEHHQQKHGWTGIIPVGNIPTSNKINEIEKTQENVKRHYRVTKQCSSCHRNVSFKCHYSEISGLPNECPFECTLRNPVAIVGADTQLTCHLCNEKIPYNWEEIKKHYGEYHKMHKCLDAKVVLEKINITSNDKTSTNTAKTTSGKVGARKIKDAKKIKPNTNRAPKQISTEPKQIVVLNINDRISEQIPTYSKKSVILNTNDQSSIEIFAEPKQIVVLNTNDQPPEQNQDFTYSNKTVVRNTNDQPPEQNQIFTYSNKTVVLNTNDQFPKQISTEQNTIVGLNTHDQSPNQIFTYSNKTVVLNTNDQFPRQFSSESKQIVVLNTHDQSPNQIFTYSNKTVVLNTHDQSPTQISTYSNKTVVLNTNDHFLNQISTVPNTIVGLNTNDQSQKLFFKDPRNNMICNICGATYESKQHLETHFIGHKDRLMAYQCMECGQNFVVKPSFSTHLLLVHGISNVDEYIHSKKQCYNENAFQKYQDSIMSFEPLKENQCKVCRKQLTCALQLALHFRVHGMAYLSQIRSSNKSYVAYRPILPPKSYE